MMMRRQRSIRKRRCKRDARRGPRLRWWSHLFTLGLRTNNKELLSWCTRVPRVTDLLTSLFSLGVPTIAESLRESGVLANTRVGLSFEVSAWESRYTRFNYSTTYVPRTIYHGVRSLFGRN